MHMCVWKVEILREQEAAEKDEVLAHAERGLAELRSLLQEEAQASVELLTALEELKDEVWPLADSKACRARSAGLRFVIPQAFHTGIPTALSSRSFQFGFGCLCFCSKLVQAHPSMLGAIICS